MLYLLRKPNHHKNVLVGNEYIFIITPEFDQCLCFSPFDFILLDSKMNLCSNVIRNGWNLSTLDASYITFEAYDSMKPCYIAPIVYASIEKDEPNE